jgi:hypothetical protein
MSGSIFGFLGHIKNFDKIVFKCHSKFFNHYFFKNEKHNKYTKQTYSPTAITTVAVSLINKPVAVTT